MIELAWVFRRFSRKPRPIQISVWPRAEDMSVDSTRERLQESVRVTVAELEFPFSVVWTRIKGRGGGYRKVELAVEPKLQGRWIQGFVA
jgi:hypothetical protein